MSRSYFLPIIWLLSATACNVRPQYIPAAIHDLGVPLVRQNQNPKWTVNRIDAPVWLWSEQIRYRLIYADSSRLRSYSLTRWVAPPPSMLEHFLEGNGMQTDYMLNIQLLNFEQRFNAPGKAQVVMDFTAEAILTENKKTRYKQDFHLQKICSSADAAGAVAGFGELARLSSTRIQEWLDSLDK